MFELGLIEAQPPEARVVVDTPSGPWVTQVRLGPNKNRDGRRFVVESVTIRPEISFAYLLDQPLDVPGLGQISVDVSFTGGFFVMLSADQIGLELNVDNAPELAKLGMDIIEASNDQLTVKHPQRSYINTIDVVEFFDPSGHSQNRGKNFVVLGEGHVDRSPCGTGTCAKLALLHKRGELEVGQTFINEGLLGTTFEAQIVREASIEDPNGEKSLPAIIPEVSGSAHIIGLQYMVVTPEDPFPEGFLL
jgi:proline racemase